MSKEYNPKEIEKKWQEVWKEKELYKTADVLKGKENEYILVEFAYPSGNLHVGHWYAFSVPDIYVRYRRMLGKNVMYPMGFDAFGLPAENAAIKNKINPREWTFSNIEYMRNQLHSMGASFDWSREVVTASSEYYKWTQWLFLKFFEKGLAYQSETPVNWCPSCKTVLANEQVVSGQCERCHSEVEKRNMMQWNLKITDYASRLVDDLDPLDWPKSIKEAQKNWIGKSMGVEIDFQLTTNNQQLTTVKVFTTRPDTIFGATYLVLSPEHELVAKLLEETRNKKQETIKNPGEVEKYINETKNKSEMDRMAEGKEKTGVELKGVMAINPANQEEIPVWIADYVLPHYGTGAIMAVPSDDERDREFAERFNLRVVENYTPAGFEDFGQKTEKYKLRDWVVSRQRYWGCPIPVIHCPKCGVVSVPEQDLPVVLPETEDFLPSDDGKSPLSKIDSFVNTKCPQCGGEARRETDTLETFIDSSWYFLAYAFGENGLEDAPSLENWKSKTEKFNHWMPISFYSGGAEHTTMHLLYSRFFHKVLFDMGLTGESEPYVRRMNRGLILGSDGQKMSKSRGNVIDPDKEVERLGADTVRMYLAFIGPYNEVGSYPWNPDAAIGVRRFLERVWKLQNKITANSSELQASESLMHQTIEKITNDLAVFKTNTAVSQLMVLVNEFSKREVVSRKSFETFLKLLAPFAPHMAEELWSLLGHEDSIHTEAWPTYDPDKLASDEVTLAVQINGKIRATLVVSTSATEDEITVKTLALSEVKKWLDNKEPRKVIVVSGKIVSIVV